MVKTEYEIAQYMSKIRSGYVDRNNQIYIKIDASLKERYVLETPEELIRSGYGLCFDQVELMRDLLINIGFSPKTYAIIHNNKEIHTFIVYKKEDYVYWFENYWAHHKGIHKYEDINELFLDIKNKFIANMKKNEKEKIQIYEYPSPTSKMNLIELTNFIKQQQEIIEINKILD